MNKEFVTYEQALVLKELGFDDRTLTLWHLKREELISSPHKGICYGYSNSLDKPWIAAPLYQQVFRWFRVKHKQDSLVVPSGDSTGKTIGYYYEIVFDFSKENIESESFKTYEEAESACLDKLIEITNAEIKNRS